jgi:hypothetical protein
MSEGITKVATGVVSAMASTPLAIALLAVNIAFLGFAGYVLREVSANARERNKTQNELITTLVTDCRQGARPNQGATP